MFIIGFNMDISCRRSWEKELPKGWRGLWSSTITVDGNWHTERIWEENERWMKLTKRGKGEKCGERKKEKKALSKYELVFLL